MNECILAEMIIEPPTLNNLFSILTANLFWYLVTTNSVQLSYLYFAVRDVEFRMNKHLMNEHTRIAKRIFSKGSIMIFACVYAPLIGAAD